MKKLSTILLSASLAVSVFMAGCSSGQAPANNESAPPTENNQQTPSPEDQAAKLLLLNNIKEPTSLDPPLGFDEPSYNILNNLMEGLTRLDENQKPQPAAASEWKISEDGRTYTFTLRDNKWSNGEPVKAQDFEYAWKRMLDPALASPAAFLAFIIEGAEAYNSGKGSIDDVKVKALDDKTLEVVLAQPASWTLLLASNPAFFPVHKATVEKDPKWAAEASTFVGNGPFKLTEWKHDSELKIMKNENYWDAANVTLAGAVWKMIDDENTEYQMFTNGELHRTTTVPADMADQLFKEGKVYVRDGAGTEFYRFNVTKEPFDNANIRKAFSLAIDRQTLVDHVLMRQQKPGTGFVSFGLPDANGAGDFRQVGGDLVKFDAAEAKRLLEQGMKEKGYTTLPEVTLTYRSGTANEKTAQAAQEMWKQTLGVDVKLQKVEGQVLTDMQKKLEYQIARSSWLPDFGDAINFLDIFQSKNGSNRTGWANAEYDKLIEGAYKEPDDAKRLQMLHDAEKILLNEAPVAPLYFYNTSLLTSDQVSGIQSSSLSYTDLRKAVVK
ncbi:dipeptide-binding protein DppE [Brevibacillus agri]|uniref:Dipeptide-binding protein DppE n=1 Tax=Brevibacillus agri TaxID=51101 RepID=A0A3M8AHM6_9BACL|nr:MULTISPECIES: peptide ABC transporter substrate-binding protein [Brevibacillus]ELK40439.1 dipeptide ABC transporter substrate-binding protein [Brevibacillus agri BAB-2500]EJL39050.1 ABC-type oligopeptide transport system, periplasmic component [Brevibacillus sp. CF112]MBG9566450.1 cytochrome C [Brevibacillus agri]MBY0054269.1 peptide ABC transporter substrate-binding protein [Brevibacillus agri]MCG5253706.1 peptide ABC transporter substrate-binding protein [Brevibacillus agri]